MTGTRNDNAGTASRPRTTWAERVVVLGGIALAALYTVAAAVLGLDMETVGAALLAALVWSFVSSLTLALRRGFRDGDWTAFRGVEPFDNSDTIDWSTKTGAYAYMRIAEEHERLVRRT